MVECSVLGICQADRKLVRGCGTRQRDSKATHKLSKASNHGETRPVGKHETPIENKDSWL